MLEFSAVPSIEGHTWFDTPDYASVRRLFCSP